jgi:glycosyltransferase involved in cell wall biosynthesis
MTNQTKTIPELERILIVSHAHPEIMKGGGQGAAYQLFKELSNYKNCQVVFLAYDFIYSPVKVNTYFSILNFNQSEVILSGGHFDHFLLSQLNTRLVWQDFRDFLNAFQPTIVHFHHYVYLGIELIREVRKYSSKVPILVTLHEYLAICNNHGQMVKTQKNQLCYQSSANDCQKCFPEKAPEDFTLRELYIKSFFNLVDLFTAPSYFLIERYISWGIPKEKIRYLDNGQHIIPSVSPRLLKAGEHRSRFAYFGQLNPYKGVIFLLEAVEKLPRKIRQMINLDIYGANLELQSDKFRHKLLELLQKTQDCVQFLGAYQVEEQPKLMANIDWVIVPSIWWENAPLVIEEAFMHKRPVICSNIGGMAEKVHNNVSGLHFQVGDSTDLADCIYRAATETGLWEKLSNGIADRVTIQEVTDQALKIYTDIKEKRSRNIGQIS